MTKIFAPNKQYNGASGGIQFSNGVAECSNPHLIDWFKSRGYVVEEDESVIRAKYIEFVDSLCTYIEQMNDTTEYRNKLLNSSEQDMRIFLYHLEDAQNNKSVKYLIDSIAKNI
ncbi:MAG: hypothetical protein FNP40_13950 [Dehalobacter sp. 4CP]|uniref:hypothetical protein n=1 Tax=Dehalobacter sp. CP TaxID=2594474 RepID=UPI0013C8C61E|nr:hypothetical protein [Dehalobacter sp. 4CP]